MCVGWGGVGGGVQSRTQNDRDPATTERGGFISRPDPTAPSSPAVHICLQSACWRQPTATPAVWQVCDAAARVRLCHDACVGHYRGRARGWGLGWRGALQQEPLAPDLTQQHLPRPLCTPVSIQGAGWWRPRRRRCGRYVTPQRVCCGTCLGQRCRSGERPSTALNVPQVLDVPGGVIGLHHSLYPALRREGRVFHSRTHA